MKTFILAIGLLSVVAGCSSHKKEEPVDEHIKQEQQEERMRTGADTHKSDEMGPGYDYGRTSPTI